MSRNGHDIDMRFFPLSCQIGLVSPNDFITFPYYPQIYFRRNF